MTVSSADAITRLSTLLQLEREARLAEDLVSLAFTAVNETWRLIRYDRAALLIRQGNRLDVQTISGVSAVDRNGGFARWLRRLARSLNAHDRTVMSLVRDKAWPNIAAEWNEWSKEFAVCVPLSTVGEPVTAWLWLTRDQSFTDGEIQLLERLGETYGHALSALRRRRWLSSLGLRARVPRWAVWTAALTGIVALLSMPVQQTALSKGEVVPRTPTVVSSSLDGVIAEILVKPNDWVDKGQPLLRLDRTKFEAEVEVAEKALAVARADFLRASQKAFVDAASNAEKAILRARMEEAEAAVAYARKVLERTTVLAQREGIAVFSSAEEILGKPIATGERVMMIVDPLEIWLRIAMPVSDDIQADTRAPVQFYPDNSPDTPFPARLTRAAYAAVPGEDGIMIYDLRAEFTGSAPRLGATGTARIYGYEVSLARYLFRRPLILLRRALSL